MKANEASEARILEGETPEGPPRDVRSPEDLCRLFHALSDETRLEILERLRNGEQCVCNLTEALEAGQSRLSYHLKTMREAGLVTDRRDGRWVHYSLNREALERMERFLAALRSDSPGDSIDAVRCCLT